MVDVSIAVVAAARLMRVAACSSKTLKPVLSIVLRREDYSDPPPAAPDYMAKVPLSTRENIESQLMRYAVRACDLQRGARRGQISDGAICTLAGKFQPSCL
jgi:hypothetical protein